MPRRPRLSAAVLLLALAGCTAGCTADPPAPATGPVAVALPPADEQAVRVCADLGGRLPDSLGDGLDRRPVTGDAARSAAWGDPAVTLACGVPPAGLPGVDGEPFLIGPPGDDRLAEFLQDDLGDANLFTTRETGVTVSVRVPDEQDAQVLQRFLVPLLDVLPPAT